MRHTERTINLEKETQERIIQLSIEDPTFGFQRTKPIHLPKDKGHELMSYDQAHTQYIPNNDDP